MTKNFILIKIQNKSEEELEWQGNGKHLLSGVFCHKGRHTTTGHYFYYVRKEKKW